MHGIIFVWGQDHHPFGHPKAGYGIYHGVRKKHKDDVIGAYSGSAFMSSLQNPCRILARSPKPFMSATEPFEINEYVSQVVLPAGTVIDKKDPDKILIYSLLLPCAPIKLLFLPLKT
jgi:hypothetical protein